MKKYIICLIIAAILVPFIGCSKPSNTSDGSNTLKTSVQESASKASAKTMNVGEFDTLLSALPLTVVSTKYAVQDEQYKALYPDMLQAVIKNNTGSDIKNAVVAFVAWDKNKLPVKIKGSMDFSNGSYVKEVNYMDINLVNGQTYGDKNGYEVDEHSNIASCKAVVVSYETFSGDKWQNPYYDKFRELYEGKKIN